MFFEVRVDGQTVLFNLAQVTRIKIAPQSGEQTAVTFCFTDGREETASLNPTVLQRLHTALPRSSAYGSGGMG